MLAHDFLNVEPFDHGLQIVYLKSILPPLANKSVPK